LDVRVYVTDNKTGKWEECSENGGIYIAKGLIKTIEIKKQLGGNQNVK